MDIGPKVISSASLKAPLVTSLPQNNEAEELRVVSKIISLLQSRKNPVIVVDGGKLLYLSVTILLLIILEL